MQQLGQLGINFERLWPESGMRISTTRAVFSSSQNNYLVKPVHHSVGTFHLNIFDIDSNKQWGLKFFKSLDQNQTDNLCRLFMVLEKSWG